MGVAVYSMYVDLTLSSLEDSSLTFSPARSRFKDGELRRARTDFVCL